MGENFKYVSPGEAYNAYVRYGYSKKLASESLGIPRTTYRRRLEQHFKDKYESPDTEYRALFLCDLHGPYNQDESVLDLMMGFTSSMFIDTVVLGGDILELQSLSTFNADIRKRLSFEKELQDSREFIKKLRSWFPDQSMVYLKGNHEERYYAARDEYPVRMKEYRGRSFPELFGLDELEIEYVDNRQYARDHGHYYRVNNLYFLHGDEIESSSSSRFAFHKFNSVGVNLIHGHHHTVDKYVTKTMENLFSSVSVGCMCDLFPHYRTANKHLNGFSVIDFFKDGTFNAKNYYVYNGRVYL